MEIDILDLDNVIVCHKCGLVYSKRHMMKKKKQYGADMGMCHCGNEMF